MVRKVFKSGNSLVVTLPPEVRDLGIGEDSEVDVRIEDGRVVIEHRTPSRPSKELLDWTDAFIERHRVLLERLA
jgi:antitoxin component of MazEF toxin-antitoxin module